MNFISFTFFLFLLAVLVGFHFLPWRIGRWFLIAASYVFYGALQPWYCVLPFLSTSIDFIAAQKIAGSTSLHQRRRWLVLSIVANLALLGFFKYVDFGLWHLNTVLVWTGWSPLPYFEWILPIGISFYTFQTMSYTIDVYRQRQEPQRDFGAFALYVVFFPQLVAGPIERARKLLPQLVKKNPVSREDLEYGVQRILWGLVKKLVFADRLALMVNTVYANPSSFTAPELIVATFCFCFQLYLDFSAYCDIAIGVARLLGIRLSENFNYPFLAKTPSDFWSRWHITLTSWFRDYVYSSLGGTRMNQPVNTLLSVLLVMSLVGLWHGAQWNFVIFGFLSGLAIVAHMGLRLATRQIRSGPLLGRHWWTPIISNVLMMITIGSIMVFFRAADVVDAVAVFRGIFAGTWGWSQRFDPHLLVLGVVWSAHLVRGLRAERAPYELSAPVRGGLWAMMLMLLLYGTVETGDQFIYFQF